MSETEYALSLLSEYTHTLDTLPIDISRQFGDLRELDAVLSSSIHSITAKIHALITMIEQGTASKEDRLWLLTEIAEEAQRLKLGGEDKIRVACQAADNLKSHDKHLRALADHLPDFDASVLDRATTYPHVSDRAFRPTMVMETGRRRRGGIGSIMVASNPEPSPAKRKRVNRDDDLDVIHRSPKKPGGDARARNTARNKKMDRPTSPSESLISVTAPNAPPLAQSNSGRGGASNRSGGSAANKRARAAANNANRSTPLVNEAYSAHNLHNSNSVRRGAADGYNLPPSSSHPSLPQPYANGHMNNGFDVHGMSHIANPQDWNIPRAQQLEGPGMPVERSSSIPSNSANAGLVQNAVVDNVDAGDADGDGDDKTYCFCDGVSYGEMIACDEEGCEREWFHLTCVGLAAVPSGTWFCDACKGKKTGKRTARGGKRRTGGARANARG